MVTEQPEGMANIMESRTKLPSATKTKSSRAGTSRKQAVNQTLSCAECRRLKLRCDRVFPCGSCQKRGIAELCPEGSLPTRNKPATSSIDKEQLYQQLSELRGRVLELEKALEVAHAVVSSEPHPLLGDEKFIRKALNKRKKLSNGSPDDGDHEEPSIEGTLDEAIGSLSVGEEGRARFFGRSACVERLFKYQSNGALATPEEPNILVSAEVAMIYQSFPMLTIGEATGLVQERIWRHLPPLHRAQSLRQDYKRHVCNITDIVPEGSGWFDDLFSRVYHYPQPTDASTTSFSDSGVQMDELALLFAYFAMAALMDLDLKPFNYEAEAYACLSRAALTSVNLLKNPTVVAVETLVLLGYFEAMWGEVLGSGDGWIITALATKLAQLMGLHRSSRQFGMDTNNSERRSRVYWEVYTLELIEGLSHGRPSTFSLIPSDVEMPHCEDPKTSYHSFRYRLAAECLSPLSKQVFGVKIPAYAAIVELDRKIRAFCADLGVGTPGQSTPLVGLSESQAIMNYTRRVLRESTLLYLHRAFFVRAVATNPSDPQHTKYGLSVSSAYECAMNLVQALREVSQDHLAASSRALLCWNHTLCSVFILGSITTRCPGSRLAPLAAKRLHDVEGLYIRAATYGGRAAADKPLVSRMAEKCIITSNAYANEHGKDPRGSAKHSPSPGHGASSEKRDPEDEVDELALLGGYTRVVNASQRIVSSKTSASPGSSGQGPLGPPLSPAYGNISPLSTDTSSLPDSAPYIGQHGRIDKYPISFESQNLAQQRGQASSPPSDTTEHHLSSSGSVSSGPSPEAGLPSLHVTVQPDTFVYADLSRKVLDANQASRDGAGFEYHIGLQDYNMGRTERYDSIRVVEEPAIQQHSPPRTEYAPMEVSEDVAGPQEWNFLDNWYGHVYSLDVIPPDYGH